MTNDQIGFDDFQTLNHAMEGPPVYNKHIYRGQKKNTVESILS